MSRAETSCFSNQDIAFVNIDVSVGMNSISLLHKIHLCSWDYKLLLIFSMNHKIFNSNSVRCLYAILWIQLKVQNQHEIELGIRLLILGETSSLTLF